VFKYLLLVCFFISEQAYAQDMCQFVVGASVITYDGSFVGKLTNASESDSIFNGYGTYGNQNSALSIWNRYGVYGGQNYRQSPFNPYTSIPPILVKEGRVIARFTINKHLSGVPNISPYAIKSCNF
jgi:hypothetical protein